MVYYLNGQERRKVGKRMEIPKKNDRVTVEIVGYASDGAGVSHLPDGRVFLSREP